VTQTPRLYVDMTTIAQEIGRHPHGTTRVERGIVATLARNEAPDSAFVVYSRATGGWSAMSAELALDIATAPTVPEVMREPEPAWRLHPLIMWARSLRRRARTLWQRPSIEAAPAQAPEDPFVPGGILLLAGEHDRQDFARLMTLKRTKQLSLVFLFYDLLHVLDDDDPRLADPLVADLPQTDFMVREASLILPISHFSAATLRRHLERRGVPGPPIVPVRLAGELPARDGGNTVPGLQPGAFVLCVGDVVHRKNHALLVEVWRRGAERDGAPPPLVIVGRIDQEGQALVQSVAHDAALGASIRFLPNADDGTLGWLYCNCRFTVFPSLLEGFGLPVAESLAYGKACIASTASAIPEAGQGVAVGLDPHDADAWLHAVRRLWRDDAALAEEEARIARDFRPVTWRDTVDDILAAIAGMMSAAVTPRTAGR
jgi:glycosyltransferase involved in cell wall biosynthesis